MPGGAEGDALLAGEREEPAAGLLLAGAGVGDVGAGAGADLDLGGDQLAGDRVHEDVVGLPRALEVLEARDELQRLRVDQRELLLEADGEVGGALEDLARGGEVDQLT